LKILNVDNMKIPKTHRGPHKMDSRATCGTRAVGLRPVIYSLIEKLNSVWSKNIAH